MGAEFAAKNVASDGVKLALKVRVPFMEGFQVQVAVKLGDVPEVATLRQPGMRLPSIKNRRKPGALTDTVMVDELPFLTAPVIVGAPKVAAEANPATPL